MQSVAKSMGGTAAMTLGTLRLGASEDAAALSARLRQGAVALRVRTGRGPRRTRDARAWYANKDCLMK